MVDYSETIEVQGITFGSTWKYTCTRLPEIMVIFCFSERNWISGEQYRTIGPLV